MVVIDALQSVLSIIIMVSIGYLLSSKKWLDDRTSSLFAKLIVNISLPAVIWTKPLVLIIFIGFSSFFYIPLGSNQLFF